MSGLRQGWLVARRELRERGRSRGFLVGFVVTLVVTVGAVALAPVLESAGGAKDVGLTGRPPVALREAIEAADAEVTLHEYEDLASGEAGLRAEDVDVLVVGSRRLEWVDQPDPELQALVTSAIQLVAVRERAASAGVGPDQLLALLASEPVENVEIGLVAGRDPDDATAAIVVSALLLLSIFVYGNLVLTGVVQEKSSRIIEVLLARMPARSLLSGKIAGIGLLGFAQFAVTASAALVAADVFDSVDIPAMSRGVLAWAALWFVLGYALYATAYGALGSLASRAEDADSAAAPAGVVLVAAYWSAFYVVSRDPDGAWATVLSLFPATAPFAMPGRIALGASAWWEPPLAVALTVVAVAGVVLVAGRLYTHAILHGGPRLRLRDAWRTESSSG